MSESTDIGAAGWQTVVPGELLRLRLPLPLGIDHVNVYAARDDAGAWLLVDCGLDTPEIVATWARAVPALDAPVSAVVVTHYHPDHVGAAASLSRIAQAPVFQHQADAEVARRQWEELCALAALERQLRGLGMPAAGVAKVCRHQEIVRAQVRLPAAVQPLGETIGGWLVVPLPGHAKTQIGLLRDGVLLAGDAILDPITPHVSVELFGAADPLAEFLASLRWIASVATLVAAGHHDVIREPGLRAQAIAGHHEERLALLAELRAGSPGATVWELSTALFGARLDPASQRFALLETAAHVAHLAQLES